MTECPVVFVVYYDSLWLDGYYLQKNEKNLLLELSLLISLNAASLCFSHACNLFWDLINLLSILSYDFKE